MAKNLHFTLSAVKTPPIPNLPLSLALRMATRARAALCWSLYTCTDSDLMDVCYLKPLRVHFLPFLVPGDPWLWVSSCLAYKGGHPS